MCARLLHNVKCHELQTFNSVQFQIGMLKIPVKCFVEMHIGGDDPLETFPESITNVILFLFHRSLPHLSECLYAVVRPKPHTMLYSSLLTSNLWPDPLVLVLNVFKPTSPHLICTGHLPSLLLHPRILPHHCILNTAALVGLLKWKIFLSVTR